MKISPRPVSCKALREMKSCEISAGSGQYPPHYTPTDNI